MSGDIAGYLALAISVIHLLVKITASRAAKGGRRTSTSVVPLTGEGACSEVIFSPAEQYERASGSAETKLAVEADIASWPLLPQGCSWHPSPIDPDGIALILSAEGTATLRVDREGRLSAHGRPLFLQLPASRRGDHAA